MKHIIIYLISVLLGWGLFSGCQTQPQKESNKSPYIILAGKSKTPNATYQITAESNGSRPLYKEKTDSLGNFHIKILATKLDIIYSLILKEAIDFHAMPGDSLYIDLTGPTPIYSGDNIKETQLINQFASVIDYNKLQAMKSQDEQTTYLTQAQNKMLEMVQKANGVSQQFKDRYALNHKWDAILTKLPDIDYYDLFHKSRTKPDYLTFLKSLMSDEAELLSYCRSVKFLERFFLHLEYANIIDSEVDNYIEKRVSFLTLPALQEQYALAAIYREVMIERTFIDENISKAEKYITTTKGNETLMEISQQAETMKTKFASIAPGKIAPDFTVNDMAGQQVSLSDFKGKVVLLDMWYLGCHPCKQEVPYLIDLEHHFEGKNIAFLTLSFDRPADLPALKSFIKEKKMKGVNLNCPEGFKSHIPKDYLVRGVPTYVIIDAEGKIVDAAAHRPSDPLLKKQLEKLLS